MASSASPFDELRRALAALRRGELTPDAAREIASAVHAAPADPAAKPAPGLAALFGSELLSASADEVRARILRDCEELTEFPYRAGDRIAGIYEVESTHCGAFGLVAICRARGGEVYARGNSLVALKTPLPRHLANPELRELFLDEAARCVALGPHPNLVLTYGCIEYNRLPFLVLECIPGARSLTADITAGATDWRTALRVGLGMARGLAFAGLVHSDIKPDNVLLGPDGTPKVSDFGLAFAPDDPEAWLMSGGTDGFRAPELWRGEPRSFASDVFSFGVTVFAAATRYLPFDHREAPGTRGPAPDARRYAPETPAEVADFLARCLALEAGHRPRDFKAIAVEMEKLHRRLLGAPPADAPPDAPLRADALVNAGQAWLNLGRPAKALAALESALALAPRNWKAHCQLGAVYQELRKHREALQEYARAAELAPDELTPLASRAHALWEAGEKEEARAVFGRAVQRANETDRLGELDSVSLLALELFGERDAYNFLSAVLSANPLAAMTWNNRAILMRRMGAYDEALDNAGRALALNPAYAKAYVQKANALLHLGRFTEARDAAERALALDDALAGAYGALSTAAMQLGDPAAALAAVERGLRRLPGDPLLERGRAQLRARGGR